MIGIKVKIEDTTKRVKDAADRATFRNLGHAAASIRKTAQSLITRAPKAAVSTSTAGTKRDSKGRFLKGSGRKKSRRVMAGSPPGSPPYTKRGQIRRAITFDSSKALQSAVIGPRESVIGESGEAHEFGGDYKGGQYPERPFMGPALALNQDRFADSWQGSIGE